eukprot:1649141-Pleurochrysis_carterae.AAC.1
MAGTSIHGGVESGSTSKGMGNVALVELGSGCCHGGKSTKAAVRACCDAVEWNSIKVRTIIPGSYEAMKVHVHLGVPAPEDVDLEAVKACFPCALPRRLQMAPDSFGFWLRVAFMNSKASLLDRLCRFAPSLLKAADMPLCRWDAAADCGGEGRPVGQQPSRANCR